jgi:acyl-CoA synthetase (AMP-forming)/AMP-acid ligase II
VTSDERRHAYETSGLWDGRTLPELVARHAAARGRTTAVVDLGGARVVDYATLDRDANRVAAFLLDTGVVPGDVVSVQLPNWYETVAIDLAVLRVGAVLNPLLPLYRAHELRHMLARAASRVLFTPREYRGFDHAALVASLRSDLPELADHVPITQGGGRGDSGDWIDSLPDAAVAAPPTEPGAVSELIFTSGTEADPKAIMHTEQTTNCMARAVPLALGLGEGDVVWMPSPIGHSTGLNFGVRVALYHGLPLVLQDRWSGSEAARLIEEQRCSYTLAAPTFLNDLVSAAKSERRDVASMRLFGSGGAPVPGPLVVEAAEAGITALRLYGSTELLTATWNRPESPLEKRVATDGPPMPTVELDVRDDDGRSVRNEPGEIFGRGPGSCVGFYADPERTAATFSPDGWIRSGDLGVLDDDGYLTIVGRKKEIIIRGGLNIAPREIEDLIRESPEVAAVAVVGLAHDRLGEVTCACVVLHDGASLHLAELTERLRGAGLATFKLPQALVRVEALPMTSTGKIRKHELVASLDLSALETTTVILEGQGA